MRFHTLLLLAGLVSSCVSFDFFDSDRDTIEGDDHGAFTQNLLIEIPLDERKREADPSASYATIEIGVSHVSGDFDQSRNAGDEYQLDDVLFLGAGEDLHSDFDLVTGSLLVHYRIPSDRITVGVLIGLGLTELDIEVKSEGQKDSDNIFGLGLQGGLSLAFQVLPSLEFFGRGQLHLGAAEYDASVEQTIGDIGAGWSPFDRFTLSAGWRFASYELDHDDDFDSDVEIDHSGPLLQLVYTH